MRTLLKNGLIYDGTTADPAIGDILIDGDRIARIAPEISDAVDAVYDLCGKSVAPGFIDVHSHNDWFAIHKNPQPYFEPFIRQGITSFVTGNCGCIPMRRAFSMRWTARFRAISRCWRGIALRAPA